MATIPFTWLASAGTLKFCGFFSKMACELLQRTRCVLQVVKAGSKLSTFKIALAVGSTALFQNPHRRFVKSCLLGCAKRTGSSFAFSGRRMLCFPDGLLRHSSFVYAGTLELHRHVCDRWRRFGMRRQGMDSECQRVRIVIRRVFLWCPM
jgi:hypothetical protein